MAKGQMPEMIFVAPVGDNRNKQRYRYVLFEVVEKHPDGTPSKTILLKDDAVIDLELVRPGMHHREFLTAYVPEVVLKGK
jgi:hypothetical protein